MKIFLLIVILIYAAYKILSFHYKNYFYFNDKKIWVFKNEYTDGYTLIYGVELNKQYIFLNKENEDYFYIFMKNIKKTKIDEQSLKSDLYYDDENYKKFIDLFYLKLNELIVRIDDYKTESQKNYIKDKITNSLKKFKVNK